ncbi:MAG: DEAD/DEAH box helicase [Nannocystaceae bacterium]
MSAHDRLFAAIQRACSPRAWSRGVELSRAGAVASEPSDDPEELVLRVAVKGHSLSPAVSLWPAECEWSCECSSRDEACFHVAAAVIALRRAHEAGEAGPSAGGRTARVGYRLRRSDGALAFDRVLVVGEGERELPLAGTLTDLARGRVEGAPTVMATAADMAIEVDLGSARRGVLPGALLKKILPKMADTKEVRLDDQAVTVDAEPVRPHVKIVDQGDGVRLSLVRNPAISEVFSNGVARCGEALRAVAGAALSKEEVERLKAGDVYPRERLAELVSTILPRLEALTTVHRKAKNLPRETDDAEPRIAFETAQMGDALAVLPLLVYAVGDGPAIARIDGERVVPLAGLLPARKASAERRLLNALERELQMSPGRRQLFTGEAALALVPRLRGRGELRGDGHRAFVRSGPLTPRMSSGTGLLGHGLGVIFESIGEDGEARSVDAAAVAAAWERGDSLVPLLGGGLAPLPHDWLARFGPHLQFLVAAREPSGALPRHALPALAELEAGLSDGDDHGDDHGGAPALAGLRALAGGYEGLPEVELPADLGATLREYQRIGVRWLSLLRRAGLGALLADDMGLGKTLQALSTLRAGERALIVAPTSVVHGWADQLARFRPVLRVSRYTGPRRSRDPAADVTLTTYAILRLDDELLRFADDASTPWSLVILDEAQTIKNPESQVAQAAFSLAADARVALTGTPVENRLDELWSLFRFLNPGLLGGRRDFQERLARPLADGSPAAAAALQARIRPFLLRRRKQEVARELPPRTEVVLRCQLGEREREVYQAIEAATRAEVIAQLAAGKGVIQALEALLRLRQAACHIGLLPGQDAARSAKVDLLIDTLAEITAEGHKALVFSQWTGLLDRIEGPLRGAGLDHCRLDGSTRDRAAVVERFQSEGGPPVMLISLKAGGTGLTLTAADHVFLVDPWWNPAVEDQAADRAHRIGQERPVMIHRLVAEDTVEERILALQGAKRAIAEAALGGALDGAQGAQSLTREDLLGLLE